MEYNEPSDDTLLGSVAQGFDQKRPSDIKLPLGQYFGVKSPNIFFKYPARLGIYETSDGSGLSQDDKSCFQRTSQQSLDNTHSGHEAHESLNPYCMYTPHRSESFLKGQDKLPSSQHLNEDSSNLGDKKLPIQLKMSQSTLDYISNQPFKKKIDSKSQLANIEKLTRENMEMPEKQPSFKKLKLGSAEKNNLQDNEVNPKTFSAYGSIHTSQEVKDLRTSSKIACNDAELLSRGGKSSKFQFLIGKKRKRVSACSEEVGGYTTLKNKNDLKNQKSELNPDQKTKTITPNHRKINTKLQILGRTKVNKIQKLDSKISNWFSSLTKSMKASEQPDSVKAKYIDRAVKNAQHGVTYKFLGSLIVFEHETSDNINLHDVLKAGFNIVSKLFEGWKTMKLWTWDEKAQIGIRQWSQVPEDSKLFRYLMYIKQPVDIGLPLNEKLMSEWATFRNLSTISKRPMFDTQTLLKKTLDLLNQEKISEKMKEADTVENYATVMKVETFEKHNYKTNMRSKAQNHKNRVDIPEDKFQVLITNGLSFIQAIFNQWEKLDFQNRGSTDVIPTQRGEKKKWGYQWLDGAMLLQGLVTHQSHSEIPYTCLQALLKTWHALAMGAISSHGKALGFELPPFPGGAMKSWFLEYKSS
ncbi:hypothetical protein CROQUDRAFT_135233 [Cronartium quercuum f. sp. fusiforme G11]|uniref:Uncharacterized protein n=1 Tax=Cronartium quercuum f. sp. fusiforme G11 TaxID=708437 RepID=A0A9P6NG04_9BASI|nr:hypothetical protein CROQUDRAFT_135233 [Cronartium quercuum f. sp. fusiforme G11]